MFVSNGRRTMDSHNVSLNLTLLSLLVCSVLQSAAGQCGPSSSGWRYWPGGKTCFLVRTDIRTSWSRAQRSCVDKGANLLSVVNQQEWEVVTALFDVADTDQLWIGLWKEKRGRPHRRSRQDVQERRRGWRWSDENPYQWSHWYDHRRESSSQPVGRHGCAVVNRDDRGNWDWWEQRCEKHVHFVCKKEPNSSPESSTLIVTTTEELTTGLPTESTTGWLGLAIGIPFGVIVVCCVLAVVVGHRILRMKASEKHPEKDITEANDIKAGSDLEASDHHYLELCNNSVRSASAPPLPRRNAQNEYDYIGKPSTHSEPNQQKKDSGNGGVLYGSVGNKPSTTGSNEYAAVGDTGDSEEHVYSQLQ